MYAGTQIGFRAPSTKTRPPLQSQIQKVVINHLCHSLSVHIQSFKILLQNQNSDFLFLCMH